MVLKVSRENILRDSIDKIDYIDTDGMQILFEDEEGRDLGGLIKDWITTIGNKIIESGALKIVPSGNYFTIDENADEDIINFTGKLIAIAFNNKLNSNIKFTSFVWKILLKERIALEDMKEYDDDIYQSLKWISENDVTSMDTTFVDQNDEELIKNGRNIKLTNKNKDKYVKEMLKRIFIGKIEKLLMSFQNGFNGYIDKYNIKQYNAKKFRDEINGYDYVDVDDWKENTKNVIYSYNYDNESGDDNYEEDNNDYSDSESQETINMFFKIISKWSQENLKKLLNFVTGSPIVPIGGFSHLNGGLFTIKFLSDSQRYPEAHTCFNILMLPKYNTEKQLNKKLLNVIEVEDFGLI
ncbi:hypothetical protein M9Y10_032573 [Tritrichomonas musculus]|uniref:HECT-type E3 ubiquitin transferase n=1 Tax=Tritrichomonas musculus TaxID=1915356 RepID=A0ABR2H0E7_9EUKA